MQVTDHNKIVGLLVAALLFAILFPIAMTQISSSTSACKGFPYNSTSVGTIPAWCSTATGTVFITLLPIISVIAVVLLFLSKSRGTELRPFWSDKRGEPDHNKIVGLAVAILLVGIIFPIVMSQMPATSVTNLWGSATTTVFTVLFPVLVIITVVLTFLRKRGK